MPTNSINSKKKTGNKVLFVFAAVLSVTNCAPCCHTCSDGTVKFWALDTPNNECAETCIDPSNKLKTAEFWVLTGGKGAQSSSDNTPCATAKFHTYNRTDTLGAGPVQLKLDKYLPDTPQASGSEELMPTAGPCTTFKHGVFADMHDGDQKQLTLEDGKLTIAPYGNNQTWVVEAMLDAAKCTAVVDFNVPGKPGPPPVNLTAHIYALISKGERIAKHGVEFTDPSGTLAKPSFPLNMWVALV